MFQEITQHVQLFSMDINEDHEHARRGTKHSNTQVDFSESTKFRIKQYIFPLIAWLITLQCKIPVTAGPINPKLPSNLKSARLQIFTNFISFIKILTIYT